jgi:hypothetical protein
LKLREGVQVLKNRDLCNEEGLWFPFKNWNDFLSIRDASLKLGEQIGEQIKRWVNTLKHKGSISFEVDGIVYGKLAPMNPDYPVLMIGFSCKASDPQTYARELGEPKLYLLGPSKEPFLMVSIDPVSHHDKTVETMTAFLKNVKISNLSWWSKYRPSF